MGLQRGIASGGIKPCRELPNIGGNCRLCVWPPGALTSGARQQVPVGSWIFGHCRALQSGRTGGAFSQNVSLVGLGLPHDLSDLLSGVEKATATLDPIDNESSTR